jgi:hypothetical protein
VRGGGRYAVPLPTTVWTSTWDQFRDWCKIFSPDKLAKYFLLKTLNDCEKIEPLTLIQIFSGGSIQPCFKWSEKTYLLNTFFKLKILKYFKTVLPFVCIQTVQGV